ncbi:MAG TPA: hypothetical protein VHZ09_11355 [Acidobacteriaceae bacterium]|jgi:hypothetical protein|nr:hypothetical protein [Acidobacteriaceae bacterium]
MNKVLRVAVLSGALTLLTSPVFAQLSSDPGGGDPPPPPSSSTMTTATTTTTAIATLLAYFGL